MRGMALFFWATIIVYFVSRKRGGKWRTAFIVMAWIFGLGFWYYLMVKSGGLISIYTVSLVALALVCFSKRSQNEIWKIGFWISIVYVVPPIIGLIQSIKG